MRKRNLLFFSLPVLLAAFAPAGRAQTGTQTTVLTSPAGPEFLVDGTTYSVAMSAFWPVGSQHTLAVAQGTGFSYDLNLDTQWQFSAWQWANGSSAEPSINVIGNIGADRYTALFTTVFRLTTQVACRPSPCAEPVGAVLVNGAVPKTPVWASPGSTEALFPGGSSDYTFAGWEIGGQIVSTFQPYSVTMNGPVIVTAVYVPAVTVTLVTNPPNLTFYADGGIMNTPTVLEWNAGSSHIISGLNVTNDTTGKRWVFASWSDGGAQSHSYVVGSKPQQTITCNYAAAAYPIFITSPAFLDLVVDSVVVPPPYSYIWGVGSTHTVSATTPQTDSQGNMWVFQSWDDGVTTPSRSITIPAGADVKGYRLTALYTQQATLTVNSTISSQVVTVNGSSCTTPCNLTFTPGAQVRAAAPPAVPLNSDARQNLLGWSTAGAAPVSGADWIAPLNTAATSITATYQLENSLSGTANPPNGGTVRFEPASPDGFYDSQAKVQVRVTPRRGYRFSHWTGDLTGSHPAASLLMNVPRNVTAVFEPAPIISRAGGSDTGGVASLPRVAPGSIASISGGNLTAASETGPASPLATTLAGATVHIGERSLALYFASPAQINFQIPSDLPLGDHTVTVSAQGMPDITSKLSVVRNAPGLFPAQEGQMYAMVLHENGTPVTATAPARAGELLTLYGTGFGPTDHPRLEGSALPASPHYMLLDPITIQVGASMFKPESAHAAPGHVGIDVVQFRLDGGAPSGAAIPIYLTVNGVVSNTLTLPVQ